MWTCADCGERHEDQFETCWKCGGSLSAPPLKEDPPKVPARQVEFKVFRGTLATWDELFSEAAAFATEVGRDRLITISHSEDDNDGVVTVWYWSGQ